MSSAAITKPTNYFLLREDDIIAAREEKYLARKLSNYLFEDYRAQLRYDRSAISRIEAAGKILVYGTKKDCIDLLNDSAMIDENPNVRAAARKNINFILQYT